MAVVLNADSRGIILRVGDVARVIGRHSILGGKLVRVFSAYTNNNYTKFTDSICLVGLFDECENQLKPYKSFLVSSISLTILPSFRVIRYYKEENNYDGKKG